MQILRRIIRSRTLVFLVLCSGYLLIVPIVFADTHYAASPSYADVSTAVSAAQSGDIVVVPAGTATWDNQLVIAKGIYLQGAGIGNTVITNVDIGLLMSVEEGENYMISDIEFTTSTNECIHSKGSCKQFRITNCKFSSTSYDCYQLVCIGNLNDTEHQYGVIDNCTFINGRLFVYGGGRGDKSWKDETDLGGSTAVYAEDCDFSQPNGRFINAIDSNNGARYVFRHNVVKDTYAMAHPLMNGSETTFSRGARKTEIYENTFEALNESVTHYGAIGIHSGTGVAFNNSVINTSGDPYNSVVILSFMRAYEDKSGLLTRVDGGNIIDGNTAVENGTGTHDGIDNAAALTDTSQSWTTDEFVDIYVYNLTDGSKGLITANTATTVTATLEDGTDNDWDIGDEYKITNGYPALDQPGRGEDAPDEWSVAPAYDDSYQPQALEPIYAWNNTMDGVVQNVEVRENSEIYIKENRDYFNSPKSGYIPYPYPHPLTLLEWEGATTASVLTSEINSTTESSSVSGGIVISDGGAPITERGVCWSTSPDPTTSDTRTIDGSGTGSYTSTLSGLTPNTTYHVRAYATNSAGTSYGIDRSFNTLSVTALPSVTTNAITSITENNALSGGAVTSDGGAPVTERGVCWSTSPNPVTSDPRTIDGSGTGSFASTLSGLAPSTTYHVRAYATNSAGTAYGIDRSFMTLSEVVLPTVSTSDLTSVTEISALGGGDVTSDGGAPVTERGVCWSTSPNPVTSDPRTIDGSGTGSFASALSGLNPTTTYHVRAYAINSAGTSYGIDRSFTTHAELELPTVTTNETTSITENSAISGGDVTSDGGAPVTERGLCWTTSPNPTTSDSKTVDGSGTGSYISTISGLTPNTTYHIRAYATNSAGTAYGIDRSFTTQSEIVLPTVITNDITSMSESHVISGGDVISDGGSEVTVRGVCWSTSSNPTTVDSKTLDGSGTGSFTSTISGFDPNSTYHVRAYATNDEGTSYGADKSFGSPSSTLTVTSPNGGESWQAGSLQNITWETTGTVGDVKIEYSLDTGANYITITNSTTNDGIYTWTVPNGVSSDCLIRVSETDGDPSDVSDVVFSITESTHPIIALSRTQLNFGSVIGEDTSGAQTFVITNSGSDTLNWSVTENEAWLSCDPLSGKNYGLVTVTVNASGLSAGTYVGTISVSDPIASNSPRNLVVYLTVFARGEDSAPIGFFDTPTSGLTVSGSVPVTGWALDDIGVNKLEIKRDPDPDDPPEARGADGLIHVGEGTFVRGSRPDVEGLYPNFPLNDRAGWGYMMLTYGLPRQGNGTFRLHAFAEDGTGHRIFLGTKQITCDNANRVQPFGSIDTPGPGETVSGNYMNFGWVLTPPPKMIPIDGSTIWISIDGVYIAHPVYNQFRQDIYDAFPGYLNRDGAVGYYWIDTTSYSNGVHTIGWYAVDDNGDADGLGSRFFEIQNAGGGTALLSGIESMSYKEDKSGLLKISVKGPPSQEVEQLDRIKIELKGRGGNRIIGWGEDETQSLPVGSTLDSEEGIFYWSIGPGFLNRHVLHFAVTDGIYVSDPVQIIVNIVPEKFEVKRGKKEPNV